MLKLLFLINILYNSVFRQTKQSPNKYYNFQAKILFSGFVAIVVNESIAALVWKCLDLLDNFRKFPEHCIILKQF